MNKSSRVRTTDAFSGELPAYLSFKWHTFLFLMLFCSNSAYFSEIQLVCDGPTDGRTDGRTVTPSARTHLKTEYENELGFC